jgi:hypothetical protein
MNITVAPVDFFTSALIKNHRNNCNYETFSENRSASRLAVELALVALESDASHTKANQSER